MKLSFRFAGRLLGMARSEAAKVIATYPFADATVRLWQTPGSQVRWSCDCGGAHAPDSVEQEVWCEHITRAAALRSIERLTRRLA